MISCVFGVEMIAGTGVRQQATGNRQQEREQAKEEATGKGRGNRQRKRQQQQPACHPELVNGAWRR